MKAKVRVFRPTAIDPVTERALAPSIDHLWAQAAERVAALRGEADIPCTFFIATDAGVHEFSAHLGEEDKHPFMQQMRHLVATSPSHVNYAALLIPAWLHPLVKAGEPRSTDEPQEGVVLFVETVGGHLAHVSARMTRHADQAPTLSAPDTQWMPPEAEMMGRMVGFFPSRFAEHSVQ